jgi:type IX secretion system PorP/SprF family membrane protein
LVDKNSVGIYRQTSLMADYVYNIELKDGKLAFGLGFGATIYNIAWNELVSTHQDDMYLLNDPESMILPNFSIGTYYYTRKYFIGISIPFLVNRKMDEANGQYHGSFDFANDNFYFTAGYTFQVNPLLKLSPSMLLKLHPGHTPQIDCNIQVSLRDRIALGLGYRNKNTLVSMLEVQLNPQLKMAYAYDFDLSPLGKCKGGSHEIGINYIFSFERNVPNPRQF